MIGSGFSLRRARPGDEDPIRTIVFDALRDHGLDPAPRTTDADLYDLVGAYLETGGDYLVLLDEAGRVRGGAGLYPLDERVVELRKMYFEPGVRGLGLGAALLHRMLVRAAELGFEAVHLETASQLEEAIALYRRFGFRRVATAPDVPRCDLSFSLELVDYRPDAAVMERASSLGEIG